MTSQRRIVTTAEGSTVGAFGPTEWGLLAIVAGVWGASFLLIAEGLESFSPGLVTWLRLVLGVAVLSLFPAARTRVDREDWAPIAVLSMVWMVVPLTLIPIAEQWVTSSLTGMINGGMPLFAAVVAASLLRRLPGRTQVLGLVIGFVGIVALSIPSGDATGSAGGIALILVATAAYGVGVNLAVPLQQRYGALPVLLRSLIVALVLTTPLGIASIPSSEWAWPSFWAVVALGVGGTALAYAAMANLVGRAGATRGAVAIYLIPIVAIVLGVWFRSESVTVLGIAGIALVLVGAFVTSRPEHGRHPSGERRLKPSGLR